MSCVSPQRSVGPVVCFESVIAVGVCVCVAGAWCQRAYAWTFGHSGRRCAGADAIRDSNERLLESCGRGHHRLQVSSSRAAPPVPPALSAGFEAGRAACERRPRRQHRARGSDLRSERVRGAEVQARASRGSSGKVQLLRTPRAPPLLNPRPPRFASVERWYWSLSGGGRVDLTTYPST